MKTLVKNIREHVDLYIDTKTGIAWVEDGTTGCGHSAHPNIDVTGSVAGMKKLGYWNQTDITIRSHGFIYNISRVSVSDALDEVARQFCRCGGKH